MKNKTLTKIYPDDKEKLKELCNKVSLVEKKPIYIHDMLNRIIASQKVQEMAINDALRRALNKK